MEKVTASEIGQAAFCPESLRIITNGGKQSKSSVIAMKEGNRSHSKLNKEVSRKEKVPCYIATYAFGDKHNITEELRIWRDVRARESVVGRLFIQIYYLSSPTVIRILGSTKTFRRLTNKVIRNVHRKLING